MSKLPELKSRNEQSSAASSVGGEGVTMFIDNQGAIAFI
jgi:hypothetical protein